MTLPLKILTIYLITIALMRLMGKSTIIQRAPYDLVSIIIVGTIVSELLIKYRIWPTLYALAILTVFHLFFSWLTLSQFANRFFLGEPSRCMPFGIEKAMDIMQSQKWM